MKIAMVTQHTLDHQPMADLTLPGKLKYSKRHNYELFVQTDNWIQYPNIGIGMEKCLYIADLMKKRPDIEWFWWSGCDCLITNHNVKLESLFDPSFVFTVTKDGHGINADTFFIKNCDIGHEYLLHLTEPHRDGTEQGHMWDDEHNPKWRSITNYLPQHYMNSYDLKFYPHMSNRDLFGRRQNWQLGDFVLHAVTGYTPQFTPEQRFHWKMNILSSHISQVIE